MRSVVHMFHLIVNYVLHWNFSERFCLDVLRAMSSQDLQRSGFNRDDAKDGLSTPLDDTSVKALISSDGINEESFQRQSFTVKD